MAGDSAVVVKTRKFKKNPLLARKQVRAKKVDARVLAVGVADRQFPFCFIR
jgi:hypothetical protein